MSSLSSVDGSKTFVGLSTFPSTFDKKQIGGCSSFKGPIPPLVLMSLLRLKRNTFQVKPFLMTRVERPKEKLFYCKPSYVVHTRCMGINHHHKHDHDHDEASHHEHTHSHTANPQNQKSMAIAAILTGSFMVAEIIGGVISGSLALIADAGHMMTDCAALTLAWIGFKLSNRPANDKYTFGYDRFAILAAFVNGLSLFIVAIWIIVEALKRLNQPVEVMGLPMLIVASLGLLINIIVFIILMRADKENLNVRGAVLHVLGDLLGSAAAIIAAIVIMYTGWIQADLIMSVLVALIVLRSAWYVVKQSAHILLEGAPTSFDSEVVTQYLKEQFPQIIDIQHIHAWSISQEQQILTMEIQLEKSTNRDNLRKTIKSQLHNKHDISHITLEFHT